MRPLNRRSFLLGASAGAASLGVLGAIDLEALAAGSSDTLLVHVFLRGAADGLSLLRPANGTSQYELYSRLRPLRASAGIHIKNAVSLNSAMTSLARTPFAMHPALANVRRMFQAGSALLMHGAGSTCENRSHFEQMDLIESGVAAPGVSVAGKTGYLNRAMQQLGAAGDLKGVAISARLPASMLGPAFALGAESLPALVTLRDATDSLRIPRTAAEREAWFREGVNDYYMGSVTDRPASERRLFGAGRVALKGLDEARLAGVVAPLVGDYGKSKSGDALRAAAEVAKVQLTTKTTESRVRIVTVDVGGWDTHAAQGSDVDNGRLTKLLTELDRALGAFSKDILETELGKKVVLVVQTEFGRTARENGSAGTDHGRGGVMMVMSHPSLLNPARRGVVLAPDFDLARLQDDRDVRVTIDYRDVMQELLVRHLGIPEAAIATGPSPIFKNGLDPYTPKSWNLLA